MGEGRFVITDQGKNNRIIGADALLPSVEGSAQSLEILVTGNDNEIVFGENFRYRQVTIRVQSNGTRTVFGRDCKFKGSLFVVQESRNGAVLVGNGLTVNGSLWMSCTGGRSITIGDGCLIASARMRTSDHHKIYALTGTEQINPPADVRIADRVWLGEEVLVLKSAVIGAGSVIGARSVVTGTVPENVVAAGSPLRVLREDIRWAP
jgi:acetyltransferase-like isoleucine patch superfamily enzyme